MSSINRDKIRVKKLETLKIPNRIPKISHQETNLNPYLNVNTSSIDKSQSFVHENTNNHSEIFSLQQESFDLSLPTHPTPLQNQYNRPRKIRNPYHEQHSPVQPRQRNHRNDNQMDFDRAHQPRNGNAFSSQKNHRR